MSNYLWTGLAPEERIEVWSLGGRLYCLFHVRSVRALFFPIENIPVGGPGPLDLPLLSLETSAVTYGAEKHSKNAVIMTNTRLRLGILTFITEPRP